MTTERLRMLRHAADGDRRTHDHDLIVRCGHGQNCTRGRLARSGLHSADEVDSRPARGDTGGAENCRREWHKQGESDCGRGPDHEGPAEGVAAIVIAFFQSR